MKARHHFFVILLLAISTGTLLGQVSFSTFPPAESGVVTICAGSSVLFTNETNPSELAGITTYAWDFGNGDTATTNGPHGILFDEPGTYTVTLEITTVDETVDLGEYSIDIEVSDAPSFIPTLDSGNNCTSIDFFGDYQMFQTQSEEACSCPNANMGPAISFPEVNEYPDGTVSTIYWGGPGSPQNGGNAESTSFVWPQPAGNTIDGALVVFPGQASINGHYSGSGSYNLVYVVEFPDGCTFSTYAIMSWGAGVINFCQNTTLSACDPFIHQLCFDNQYPGNTYTINWGDGSEEEVYNFPNLPTTPNTIPHQFPVSCSGENDETTQSYLITVTALNLCHEDTTTNTQGPFEVSVPPEAIIGYDPPDLEICQDGSIVFTDLSYAGYEASNGTCSDDYDWQWSINGGNNTTGNGYEVTSGSLGSEIQLLNGTEEIEVTFDEPGTYQIGLKVYNAYCTDDNTSVTVIVHEYPVIADDDITVCTTQPFSWQASPGGGNVIPPGTLCDWYPVTNGNISGAASGQGLSVIEGQLTNLTNEVQYQVYEVTPYAGDCVGPTFELEVEVVPSILVPDQEFILCQEGEVNFAPQNSPPDLIIPAGTSFSWTVQQTPDVDGENNGNDENAFQQNLSTNIISPAAEVIYDVTATSDVGCGSETFEITVILNNLDPGEIADDQLICAGGDPEAISFSVSAEGAGTLSYQWQEASDPDGEWTDIDGATGTSYNPPSTFDPVYYRVEVASTLGDNVCLDYTEEVVVAINVVEVPSISPNQVLCPGEIPEEMALVGEVSAQGSLTFQWQQSNSVASSFGDIPGATQTSFNPTNPLQQDRYYRLLVTSESNGVACSLVSDTAWAQVINIDPGTLQPSQTLCEGETPEDLVVTGASGDAEVDYLWQTAEASTGPFGVVAGQTSSETLSENLLNEVDAFYQVEISAEIDGVTCSQMTDALEINFNLVTPGESALGQTHCAPADPDLLIPAGNATADGNLSYQWFSASTVVGPWSPILGATGATYNPSGGIVEDVFYRRTSTSALNGVACSADGPPTEIVINNLDPGGISADDVMCVGGDPAPLLVAPEPIGDGGLAYQWYTSPSENGPWAAVSGATNLDWNPPAGILSTTHYQLGVTSTLNSVACTGYTASANAEVVDDPAIVVQPIPEVSVCTGEGIGTTLEVNVEAGLGDITYQWFGDNGALTGETSPTFSPNGNLTPGTYAYQVLINWSGNGCDGVTSNPTEVTVLADPEVNIFGVDTAYCSGAAAAELNVLATGGIGPHNFAWYVATVGDLADGVPIAGATSQAFTPPTDVVGTFFYYCVVTGAGHSCEAVSDPVQVEITPSPAITTVLIDQSGCIGAEFDAWTVAYIDGTGVPSYQWFSNTTATTSGAAPLADATASSFAPPATEEGTAYFFCEISFSGGGCAATTSNLAAATVEPPATFETDFNTPILQCVGGQLETPLEANWTGGDGAVSFQWFDANGAIPGAMASTYTPPSFEVVGDFIFSVDVAFSGVGCPSVTSSDQTVSILPDPTITLEPIASSYCQDASEVLPLEVAASDGLGDFSYQWHSNDNDSNVGGTAIPGANGATFAPPVDVVGTTWYYCEITMTGTHCNVTSSAAAIEVTDAPDFVDQPFDETVCLDGEVQPLVVSYVDGTGAPSYQWFVASDPDGTAPAALLNANNPGFTPPSDEIGTLFYFCTITFDVGGCAAITSDIAAITVVPHPVLSISMADTALCVGGTLNSPIELSYTGGVGSPTYTWFDDNGQVTGNDADSYLPPDFTSSGEFAFTASLTLSGSGCNVANTDTVELVVVPDPVMTIEPISASYCQDAGDVLPLEVAASGGLGAFIYQWYSSDSPGNTGGTVIPGANEATLTPPVDVVGTTWYYCVITMSGTHCNVTTQAAEIEVVLSPTFSMQPISQTVCIDVGLVPLEVAYMDGTGNPSYQWFVSATEDGSDAVTIPGANANAYLPPSNEAGEQHYFVAIEFDSGGCESIESDLAYIHVNQVIPGQILEDQIICAGDQPSPFLLDPGSTGEGSLSYQWLSSSGGVQPPSWTAIAGEDLMIYAPPPLEETMLYTVISTSTWDGVACSDTSEAVEVWVNPLPQVAPFPPIVICNNGEVNLPIYSDLNAEYVWSAANNIFVEGEVLAETATDVIVDVLENTSNSPQLVTYTITPTSTPEGCQGPDVEAVVQVMPDIVLSSFNSTSTCSDAPVNQILEANVLSTFEWFVTVDNPNVTGESITGGTGNVIDDVLVNNSNSDQIVVYSITPTSITGNCVGSPQTLAALVKPPIELTNPLGLSICSGSGVNLGLDANTSVTFNWFASSTPNVSGESLNVVNGDMINDVLVHGTTEVITVAYSVVATSQEDGCSSPVTTIEIEVNPIPDVLPLSNLSVCHNTPMDSIFFEATTAETTFEWTVAGGNLMGQFNTTGEGPVPGWTAVNGGDNVHISPVTAVATFSSGGAACASAPMTFDVQVMPFPDLDPLVNHVICENDVVPATIPSSPSAEADFAWWVNAPELGLPMSGEGVVPSIAANNPLTSTMSTQVWVTAQVANEVETCPGDTGFFTITVHPAPEVLPFVDEICPEEAVYIPVNTDIPSGWTWQAVQNPNVTGETAFPPQNGPIITDWLDHDMNNQQVVEYVVSPVATATGCPGPQVTLYGVVNPRPYLAFSTLSESICDSLNTTLVNNSLGNMSYEWDFGNGETSTLEDPTTVYVDAGIYNVTLFGTHNVTGCENTLTQTFVVDETPHPTFMASSTSECGLSVVAFDAMHHMPNWNYLWNFGDGETSTQPYSVEHVYQPDGCYDVSLAVETDAGCEAAANLGEQVCVQVEPTAQFSASDNNFEELSPEVFFDNLSSNATQYTWLVEDEPMSTSVDFVHTFEGYGDFTVTLFASNGPGCFDLHKETITVNPFLIAFVPNAFTPGNTYDGHNDAFIPVLSNYDVVESYLLRIFDRWGNMVFESKDPHEHWIGNCQAREEPRGDYFMVNDVYNWVLTVEAFDAKPETQQGHVTLIR